MPKRKLTEERAKSLEKRLNTLKESSKNNRANAEYRTKEVKTQREYRKCKPSESANIEVKRLKKEIVEDQKSKPRQKRFFGVGWEGGWNAGTY